MLNLLLFWAVVAVIGVGQLLLVRSAWRLRHTLAAPPAGVPRSDARSDLAWTVITALATAAVLYAVYLAL